MNLRRFHALFMGEQRCQAGVERIKLLIGPLTVIGGGDSLYGRHGWKDEL